MKMAYKLDSVFKVLMFFKAVFPELFQLADHKICKKIGKITNSLKSFSGP